MNKVELIGRLTKDPEKRISQNESAMPVTRYTLAIDRRFNKKQEEQTADFINIVAFGNAADFAGAYFKKGLKVAVTGHLQSGSYTNKEGIKVYTTDVVAEDQEFVESKNVNALKNSENNTPVEDPFEGLDIDESELPFK